jgi:hypothetical protein
VFLSHLHGSRSLVGAVKRELAQKYGIAAFVAHDDIHPSTQWRNAIRAALATCDAFVAFMDPGFHQSQWCDQEAGWALGRNIPILVVRPRGFDRSAARDGFLEEHQDVRLDARGVAPGRWDAPWVAFQIFWMVVRDNRTRPIALGAAVEAFVHSGSFDATRTLWELIEGAEHELRSEQLRRLEYAVQTNDQVYAAVYPAKAPNRPVSELVSALIARIEPPAPSMFDDEPF